MFNFENQFFICSSIYITVFINTYKMYYNSIYFLQQAIKWLYIATKFIVTFRYSNVYWFVLLQYIFFFRCYISVSRGIKLFILHDFQYKWKTEQPSLTLQKKREDRRWTLKIRMSNLTLRRKNKTFVDGIFYNFMYRTHTHLYPYVNICRVNTNNLLHVFILHFMLLLIFSVLLLDTYN